jgi:hypothetical protein
MFLLLKVCLRFFGLIIKPGEIRGFYWENVHYTSTSAIRSIKYKKCLNLVLKAYSMSISRIVTIFFWIFFFLIGRIKCGFKFDVKLYVKTKLVPENCSTCYPCCVVSNSIPNFTQWILLCPKFEEFRQQFIQFYDEI